MTLRVGLLQAPREARFLMCEVPLYASFGTGQHPVAGGEPTDVGCLVNLTLLSCESNLDCLKTLTLTVL